MRRESQAALVEGNAHRAAGRAAAAVEAYRRSLAIDPQFASAHYNLGLALRDAGERRASVLAFREAARLDPGDFDAMRNVVATLARTIEAGEGTLFESKASPAQGDCGASALSIVVCSVDDRRLAAMQRNYSAALGALEHQFVVIRDARSLAEGYSRGLEQSHHELVVFSHDDVELVSPRPFGHIVRALERYNLVGLAGSRRVSGPAVMWAGHPHVHAWVSYPANPPAAGWDAGLFSLEGGLLAGMQALDGLFFAARREVVRKVGFDAPTFDGFHFYDLDFTYRAHLAGFKLAITTDVLAIHESPGRFDDDWKRYAERFQAKFPALSAPAGDYHAYGARFASKQQLVRFFAELRALGEVA